MVKVNILKIKSTIFLQYLIKCLNVTIRRQNEIVINHYFINKISVKYATKNCGHPEQAIIENN